MRSVLLLVLLAILGVRFASAQGSVPLPDTLVWERVALSNDIFARFDVQGVGFCGNSLYATEGGVKILNEGGPGYPASAGTWEEVNRSGGKDAECVDVADRSILYIQRGPGGLYRSLNGGYTIEEVLFGGRTVPVNAPDLKVIAYFNVVGYGVCRTADGEVWDCRDYVEGDTGFPRVFAAARPGGPIPENRLMANGQGGPAYSDDGETWLPSNLMLSVQTFAFGLAVIDGGPLHGRALAIAQNGSGRYHVYESTDGAMWTDVGPAPDAVSPGRAYAYLLAVPGGLVAAYGAGTDIWISGDAGRTWRLVFDVDGPLTSNDHVSDVEVGPDGRLYAAASSQGSQDAAERGGVYRTAEPLFVVAGDSGPAEATGLIGLSVRPNPAGGRVEVVVSLAEAGAVRVVVLDALGREVAVAFDGAVPAGEQVVGVETGAWPSGVYVVHAEASGRVASARLVVAR